MGFYLDAWNSVKMPGSGVGDSLGGGNGGGNGGDSNQPDANKNIAKVATDFGKQAQAQALAQNYQQQQDVKRQQAFNTQQGAKPAELKAADDKWRQGIVQAPQQQAIEDRLQKGSSSGSFHPVTQADMTAMDRMQKGAFSGAFTVITQADAQAANQMQKGSWSGSSTYNPNAEIEKAAAEKKQLQQGMTDQYFLARDARTIAQNGGVAPTGFRPYQPVSTRPQTPEDIKAKMTHDVMQATQPNNPKYAGAWRPAATTPSQIQYDMNNSGAIAARSAETTAKANAIVQNAYSPETVARAQASNPATVYAKNFVTSSPYIRPVATSNTFSNISVGAPRELSAYEKMFGRKPGQ